MTVKVVEAYLLPCAGERGDDATPSEKTERERNGDIPLDIWYTKQ
jgi:hypothetical protein